LKERQQKYPAADRVTKALNTPHPYDSRVLLSFINPRVKKIRNESPVALGYSPQLSPVTMSLASPVRVPNPELNKITSRDEVKDLIQKLPSYKAAGHDGVTNQILQAGRNSRASSDAVSSQMAMIPETGEGCIYVSNESARDWLLCDTNVYETPKAHRQRRDRYQAQVSEISNV